MPIVVTIDQRKSRRGPDHISTWVKQLNEEFGGQMELPFVRTVGDEMQALPREPEPITELMRRGMRHQAWWIGIGIGSVERPLGKTAADSRGTAFYNAREAIEQAKESRYGFAVVGEEHAITHAISASFTLLGHLIKKRGAKSEEAVELARQGLNSREMGQELGITAQAAWQRLRNAAWDEEREGLWLSTWLLRSALAADA